MSKHTARARALVLAAAGAFALAGCAPKAQAPAADTAKDVEAIKAWVTQFNADYKAKAADKVTADGEATSEGYAPGSGLVKSTPNDAKDLAAQFTADPALNIELKVDRAEVSKGGDLGYVIGDFSRTTTDAKSKKAVTTSGGYVLVLRKQADGSWKMVAYSATPGPTAPAAAPAAAAPAKS